MGLKETFILPLVVVLGSSLNAQVQAYRSYDVYDSVGVNTHWTYGAPYQYLPQFSTLVSLMQQAQIRHDRDSEWGNGVDTTPWVTSMWSQLNAAGIKTDLIGVGNNNGQTLAQLEADLKLYPGIEAIEAPNEWDLNGGSTWVSTMLAKLPILHQAGVDLNLPVIGPSLVEGSSFSQLGDVSQYLTYGNIHDYQGGRNPESSGWGGGVSAEGNGYGSILWNVDMAHEYAPGLPVMATETGAQTGTTGGTIPETVEGTYAPRLYLASFLSGVPRTYIYELIDAPYGWSSYGLLRYDLSPKPAFTAISNLLSILQDVDTQFTPESVNYTLTGNLSGVDTLLVQKSAGDFYLAVWLNGSIFDTNAFVATPIAPQQLSLSISDGFIVSGVYSFNPDGAVTTASANQATYTVNANSCVTLLHITSAKQVASPVLSLPSGNYSSAQALTISDSTPGAAIYYTTNGSAPTAGSSLYTGPITISSSETINAIASTTGFGNSANASAAYTVNLPTAAPPTFSVSAGTYASPFSLTLTSSTPGAKVYYSVNDSSPTTQSNLYAGAIAVTGSETIYAFAVAPGASNSAVSSATYTITGTTAPSLLASANHYRLINQASGLCIDDGGNLSNGAALTQWQCWPGNTNQEWSATPSSNAGFYTISNANSNSLVWTATNGSASNNTPLEQSTATQSQDQQWAPIPLASGYYEIVNSEGGLCLTVPGGANSNGLQLEASVCTGAPSQSFVLGTISTSIVSGGWYTPISAKSGMCLTLPGSGSENGTALSQGTCGTLLNQEWQFQPTSNGFNAVRSGEVTSLVWDDTGGSTANGNGMQVWSWANNTNQQWLPALQSNGLWTFVNRTSADCMDNANSVGSGTQMTQWACGSNNPNQEFELMRVR
jgi:hypothetical protein